MPNFTLEYERAQESAQHYNTMIWTLVSIGIAFSILILKTVLYEELKTEWIRYNFLIGLITLFLGFYSLFYFGLLIEKANEKMRFKYDICKAIEEKHKKDLVFLQHLKTDLLPLHKINPKGIVVQRIMRFLLFIIYGGVIVSNVIKQNQLSCTEVVIISIIGVAYILALIWESALLIGVYDKKYEKLKKKIIMDTNKK